MHLRYVLLYSTHLLKYVELRWVNKQASTRSGLNGLHSLPPGSSRTLRITSFGVTIKERILGHHNGRISSPLKTQCTSRCSTTTAVLMRTNQRIHVKDLRNYSLAFSDSAQFPSDFLFLSFYTLTLHFLSSLLSGVEWILAFWVVSLPPLWFLLLSISNLFITKPWQSLIF